MDSRIFIFKNHVIGFIVAVVISAAFTVKSRSFSDKAAHDQVVSISNDDAAMRQAFAKAHQTLPEFFQMMAHPDPGAHDFAVKVGVAVPRGFEFIWLISPHLEQDNVVGTVSNQPNGTSEIRQGQTIAVPRAKIVDWTYRLFDGRVGNYSACALLTHAGPGERAEFLAKYKLSCDS